MQNRSIRGRRRRRGSEDAAAERARTSPGAAPPRARQLSRPAPSLPARRGRERTRFWRSRCQSPGGGCRASTLRRNGGFRTIDGATRARGSPRRPRNRIRRVCGATCAPRKSIVFRRRRDVAAVGHVAAAVRRRRQARTVPPERRPLRPQRARNAQGERRERSSHRRCLSTRYEVALRCMRQRDPTLRLTTTTSDCRRTTTLKIVATLEQALN